MDDQNYDPCDAKAAWQHQANILRITAICVGLNIILGILLTGVIWAFYKLFAANPGLKENIGDAIGIACGVGLFGILLGIPIYCLFSPTINLVTCRIKRKLNK